MKMFGVFKKHCWGLQEKCLGFLMEMFGFFNDNVWGL